MLGYWAIDFCHDSSKSELENGINEKNAVEKSFYIYLSKPYQLQACMGLA
jgi:hypothetical protein